ncbi:MAG: GNAT family N-acetyltransferase [Rickettsiales bacterium]
MSESLATRYLTVDDAEIFKTLRLRSLKEEPDSFFFTYKETKDKPLSYWQGLLAKEYNIGAFMADQLVGFSGMWVEEGEKIKHRAYLGAVYVAPEARGKGVAKRMLGDLIQKAEEIGLEHLRLSTNSKNETNVGLYTKMGFEPYGIEKNYLKLEDGSYIDEVQMIKFLK